MRSLFLATLAVAASAPTLTPTASAQYVWRASVQTQDTESTMTWGRVRFNPTSTATLWAARPNFPNPELPAPPPGDGLWGSDNNGGTWHRVNSGPLLDTHNVLDFAFCPSNGDIAFAATNAGGIFKTVDGGVTWTDVSGGISYEGAGFPNDVWGVTSVATHPDDCDRVYIGIGNLSGLDISNPNPNHPGFFYSDDGGTTWTANNEDLPPRNDDISDFISETTTIQSITTSSSEPNSVFMAMVQIQVNLRIFGNKTASAQTLIYRNDNAGAGPWVQVGTGLPAITQGGSFGAVARVAVAGSFIDAFALGSNTVLFATHFGYGQITTLGGSSEIQQNRGIFALPPGGSTWIPRNNGLPVINDAGNSNSINATCIAIRPTDVYTILAGISDSEAAGEGKSNTWVTTTAGDPWINGWSSGLESAGDYHIANTNFLAFNKAGNRVAASITWDDGSAPGHTPFDGIYVLP